jgi:3-deoxy-7-phosphoheptulonate synthase
MIIHLTKDATPRDKQDVLDRILSAGLNYENLHATTGISLIGVLGDTSGVEEGYFLELSGVDKVIRISRPYKLVSREFSSETKIIRIGNVEIGGSNPALMAGPCALENAGQVETIAHYVAGHKIPIMRGGAYKPRTSPYAFQGMGLEGLELLAGMRKKYGLKIITEATGLHRHRKADGTREERTVLENVIEYADIIQVGARNMKAYGFLQELAILTKDNKKPVLLKRGESSTIKDFLLAAEYLVANGNPNVMLCLRGIRTFEEEKFQRYTADIGAIPVLKKESNLPVMFDPSHATGYRANVYWLSMAAIAAGADGLIIETHSDPAHALCDGEQCVTKDQLGKIKDDVEKVKQVLASGKLLTP